MAKRTKQNKVYEKSIKRWPVDDRPREKLLKRGEHTLSDSELLAILLRTGVKGESAIDLARKIINKFKTFRNMSHTDLRTWKEFNGLGIAKIAQIRAAMEIARRFNFQEKSAAGPLLKTTEDVVNMLKSRMRDHKSEIFKLILCDPQNRMLEIIEIAQGTPTESYPIIRKIVSQALQHHASGIICLHNHPHGDPSPSRDDARFTSLLKEACIPIGLELLDHIIFGIDKFYSFDKNYSAEYEKIC